MASAVVCGSTGGCSSLYVDYESDSWSFADWIVCLTGILSVHKVVCGFVHREYFFAGPGEKICRGERFYRATENRVCYDKSILAVFGCGEKGFVNGYAPNMAGGKNDSISADYLFFENCRAAKYQ